MHNQAAIINAHYARVEPKWGGSSVSVLSRERKFPVKQQELIVISRSESASALRFESYGKVTEILDSPKLTLKDLESWPNAAFAKRWAHDLKKPEAKEKPIWMHSFKVGEVHTLEGPNCTLDRLAYSLMDVEQFNHPIVHFQQQLRQLDLDDFETIRHGWVYVARTAFAKVANALPLRNRLEFRLWMDREFGREVKTDIDYIKYFALLFDYLEARIFSRGKLLIATDEMIRESSVGIAPGMHGTVGLADDDGNVDSIHEQANRFRLLFEKGKPKLLRDLNAEVQKDAQGYKRFKDLFRNKPLPLNLTS